MFWKHIFCKLSNNDLYIYKGMIRLLKIFPDLSYSRHYFIQIYWVVKM